MPTGLGIGSGGYVEFRLCLDCGRVQGEWPIAQGAVDEAFLKRPAKESWWDKNKDELLQGEEDETPPDENGVTYSKAVPSPPSEAGPKVALSPYRLGQNWRHTGR